ncbi:hypothetical protein NECAME_16059 [Necator americanus]|uniref:Uncharacterized protein n=1 Tax=Necator americanus TaxID=51031 RepID=W2U0K9_NECAM|nr:hypothetical protein NECAME_16059 [Necator americanus]ETN86886.1 hypothetical protein NECAME_16059 [Necator americanus]
MNGNEQSYFGSTEGTTAYPKIVPNCIPIQNLGEVVTEPLAIYNEGEECCASPLLRFILHLLSDVRQENLVSWYGGPFGVKIWNTRKFTERYNVAMGTNMNFTNVSRALQSCEHITIAGVRLWKRRKQGEYSFFPCYTGHGFPNIPPAAMPKDIPPYFPFERQCIVKTPQTGYGECLSPPDTSHLLPAACYKQPPPYHHILTPGNPPQTTSDIISYQSVPQYSAQILSPAPSLGSFEGSSPTMSITSPSSSFPILCSAVLTPPPSDTSACSSDSLNFNDSLNTQPYSPISPIVSFGASAESFLASCRDPVPQRICSLTESKSVVTRIEQSPQFQSIPVEPISIIEKTETKSLSLLARGNPQREFTETPGEEEEDIFGSLSNILGYDVSIDETSLLYN